MSRIHSKQGSSHSMWQVCFTLATCECDVHQWLHVWPLLLNVASVLYLCHFTGHCMWQVFFTSPLWDVMSRIHSKHGSSHCMWQVCFTLATCECDVHQWLHVWPLLLNVASVLYLCHFTGHCMWQVFFTSPLWDVMSRIHSKHGSSHCMWQVCFTLATCECDVHQWLHVWPLLLNVGSVLYLCHFIGHCMWGFTFATSFRDHCIGLLSLCMWQASVP